MRRKEIKEKFKNKYGFNFPKKGQKWRKIENKEGFGSYTVTIFRRYKSEIWFTCDNSDMGCMTNLSNFFDNFEYIPNESEVTI